MKKFDELNYYELLEIPSDASLLEIKRAYKNALETYSEDSLTTYSLFANNEREKILKKIKNAYGILIDDKTRKSYDVMLNKEGNVDSLKYGDIDETTSNMNSINKSNYVDSANQRYTQIPLQMAKTTVLEEITNAHRSEISASETNDNTSIIPVDASLERQKSRGFRKYIVKIFKILVLMTLVLLFFLVGSYSIFVGFKFVEKGYFTGVNVKSSREEDQSARLIETPVVREDEVKKREGPVHVARGTIPKSGLDESREKYSEVYVSVVSVGNIRSEPTIESHVIMKIYRGKKLEVIGIDGEWLKLKLEGNNIGWIHQSLVRKMAVNP